METTVIKKNKAKQNTFGKSKPTSGDVVQFNQLKALDKEIRRFGLSDQQTEEKLIAFAEYFRSSTYLPGEASAEKVLAIYCVKMFQQSKTLDEKIFHLELAHDHINKAVIISGKHVQPSLLKHQGSIKSLLAECLHKKGDHYNANLLQTDASRILGKLVYEHPDYPEARMEMVAVQVMKLPATLQRILMELEKAEQLFANPTHTKHISDAFELEEYHSRIEEMRNAAKRLLSLID